MFKLFKNKRKYHDISDFFIMDIYDMQKSLCSTNIMGVEDLNKILSDDYDVTLLPEIELGLFNRASIVGLDDNTIVFNSETNIITPQLESFINWYAENNGNDLNGNGIITEADKIQYSYNAMIRMWDKLWLCLSDAYTNDATYNLELTLFHVTQKK